MEGGGGSFALDAEKIFYVFSSYAVGAGGGGGRAKCNLDFPPPPHPQTKERGSTGSEKQHDVQCHQHRINTFTNDNNKHNPNMSINWKSASNHGGTTAVTTAWTTTTQTTSVAMPITYSSTIITRSISPTPTTTSIVNQCNNRNDTAAAHISAAVVCSCCSFS